jgi:hypothetical protein
MTPRFDTCRKASSRTRASLLSCYLVPGKPRHDPSIGLECHIHCPAGAGDEQQSGKPRRYAVHASSDGWDRPGSRGSEKLIHARDDRGAVEPLTNNDVLAVPGKVSGVDHAAVLSRATECAVIAANSIVGH